MLKTFILKIEYLMVRLSDWAEVILILKNFLNLYYTLNIKEILYFKRFGNENPAFLSFPKKGWTLAIDIPLSVPKLEKTLFELDMKIAEAGGRIYLAKDSRQSSKIFSKTYPKLKYWQMIKRELDPNFIFTSDLYNRITDYK